MIFRFLKKKNNENKTSMQFYKNKRFARQNFKTHVSGNRKSPKYRKSFLGLYIPIYSYVFLYIPIHSYTFIYIYIFLYIPIHSYTFLYIPIHSYTHIALLLFVVVLFSRVLLSLMLVVDLWACFVRWSPASQNAATKRNKRLQKKVITEKRRCFAKSVSTCPGNNCLEGAAAERLEDYHGEPRHGIAKVTIIIVIIIIIIIIIFVSNALIKIVMITVTVINHNHNHNHCHCHHGLLVLVLVMVLIMVLVAVLFDLFPTYLATQAFQNLPHAKPICLPSIYPLPRVSFEFG